MIQQLISPRRLVTVVISLALPVQVAWAQSETPWGSCRSYCSQTEIGNSLIEVRLNHGGSPQARAGVAGVAQIPATQPSALEITTYEDGFARGRWIALPLTGVRPSAQRAEGTFSTSRNVLPQRRDAPAPGLESISVRSVVEDASSSPLSVSPRAMAAPQLSASLVTLDQAEPGRTYFLRPAASDAALLTCQAAICPMDRVGATPRSPR